jgi:C_GCAxxG_C_C family probable redox protein
MDLAADKVSDRAEKAVENFSKGFNCSQAVLGVFANELGLDGKTASKVSSGFGGGIARGGDICGAVTGAVMAIGLKIFSPEADLQQSKAQVYKMVKEFKKRFKKQHGSIVCRKLLGCNIATAKGAAKAVEDDLHRKVCVGLVKDAVKIVEEICVDKGISVKGGCKGRE